MYKTELFPMDADIGDIMVFEEEGEIGYWKKDGFAAWNAHIDRDGRYDVYMLASCGKNQGGIGKITIGELEKTFTVYETASFSYFHYIMCDDIFIAAGDQRITIQPVELKDLFFMNLKQVVILPHGEKFAGVLTKDIKREGVIIPPRVHERYDNLSAKTLYKLRLDDMLRSYESAGGKKVDWPGGLWHGLAILYRETEEKKYLDIIIKKALCWMDIYKRTQKLPQYNFPSKIGIVELLEIAGDSGRLSAEQADIAVDMIKSLVFGSVYEGGGVMNRNLGYCLGIRAAEEYIKDEPDYRYVKSICDNLDAELELTCEPLENSTNYEDITLMFLINYIEKSGMTNLYRTNKMRRTFYNLLFKTTPDYAIPSYGDYGGRPKHSMLFAAIFEYAAKIYRDGRFKYAADRICQKLDLFKITPDSEAELNGWDFIGLAHAYEWCDETVRPKPPEKDSVLIFKNNGGLDKAVFNGGGLYMMMDFVNGCEHGCSNALAVMSVIKDGKTVLYDMGGRDEGNHSKPFIRRRECDFPKVCTPSEEWEEGCVRLSDYWSWGVFNDVKKRYHSSKRNGGNDFLLRESGMDYEPEEEFMIALFDWHMFSLPGDGRMKDGAVYIKNLRLAKKDKSEYVLPMPKRFYGRGKHMDTMFKLDVNHRGGSTIGVAVFGLPLDILNGEYEYLKYDIKTEGLLAKDLMITVGDRTYYPHNYPLFLNPMHTASPVYFRKNELGTEAAFETDTNEAHIKRETAFVNGLGIWIKDTIKIKNGALRTAGCAWRAEAVKRVSKKRFLVSCDGDMYISFLDSADLSKEGKKYNRYVITDRSTGRGELVFDTLLHFKPNVVFNDGEAILNNVRVTYESNGFRIEAYEGGT